MPHKRENTDQRPRNLPPELFRPSEEFVRSSEKLGLHWWHWDHVGRSLMISPSLMKILGYSPEEFDPSVPTIDKNIHPDDVKENLRRLRELISGKEDRYEMEYRVRGADGEWQWYYNRGLILARDESEKALIIGGISMDMSGNFKHMMARLQESEKFEFIFRNSDEAMIILEIVRGRLGNVIDANEAAKTLFGAFSPGFELQIPMEFKDDPVLGEKGTLIGEVLKKGFGREERKLKDPRGEDRWLEFTAHSFSRTGKKFIISIIKDITWGRKTEAALRESERLYQTLVESAEDPIGLFTTDGNILLVNSAFYRTFGFEKEEFLQVRWPEVVHEEDRHLISEGAVELMEKGTLSLDYRTVHKDGSCLFVSSKSVLIRGEQGEKDMILTIIRDVTESRRTIMELEKAKQKAEESDKLKSAFLANMSHEIRTPMNSIVGFSNLLDNPDLEETSRSMYVKRITRNSELLLTLISDIIDLAKIESGQLSLVFGKQELGVLLEEMGQYASEEVERLNKRDVRVALNRKEGECTIETDLIRLSQVLKNLINNAVKFTEEGVVRIDCRLSTDRNDVIFSVEDSGVGIAREDLELIFDQFRQVDGSNTRKFGGTGLGLAICKNMVELLGGRIWVESTPGKGSTFFVRLPRKVRGSKKGSVRKAVKDLPAGKKIPALKILVVEDEPDSLDLFSEMLSRMGHTVLRASTGYEALALLEKEEINLVFMDDQMPVMSGTDTLRIIRSRFGSLKVVAQSAHALVGDRARFIKEGFDAYLPKPFTEEQLQEVLASLVPVNP